MAGVLLARRTRAAAIADRSRQILSGLNILDAQAPVGLYVHVPFCLSLCPYCEFVVYSGSDSSGPRSRVDAFLAALRTELDLRAEALDRRFGPPAAEFRPALETLYFGGGTPSLLPAELIAKLIGQVRERYGLAPGAEITIEANPGRPDRGDAAALVDAGITRLSIGAQSLQDAELQALGRRHRSLEVAEALAEARAAGVGSIGMDLLYDIPGQTSASWRDTLRRALDLAPDHLSLYALTLGDPAAEGLTGELGDHLPARGGALRWRTRARRAQDDDRAAEMYELAASLLGTEGWRGYEISNWARPGHESRHNEAYWERRRYEAVGPGAHAFDGVTRRWNAARLDGYVAALSPHDGPPRLPPGGFELLDERTTATERLVLGLRTERGVAVNAFAGPGLSHVIDWALPYELLTIDDQRVRLTTKGRLLSNEIFQRLV
jgi:oxygen-independent coproporphyrinogen-3 oxidase